MTDTTSEQDWRMWQTHACECQHVEHFGDGHLYRFVDATGRKLKDFVFDLGPVVQEAVKLNEAAGKPPMTVDARVRITLETRFREIEEPSDA